LIVVRHAQSVANLEGRIDSKPPGGPLSPVGEQQAEMLAARLASRRIGRVLCSTSLRALMTATPVARAHGLEPEQIPELRELACGSLDGRNDAEARAIYEHVNAQWMAGERGARTADGETWNECRDRLLSALAALPDPPWSQDIILVTHAGAVRVLLCTVLGDDIGDHIGFPHNAGLVELVPLGAGRWEMGDYDHGVLDVFKTLDASARE
jgi:broad specificity phosphatase PhoE